MLSDQIQAKLSEIRQAKEREDAAQNERWAKRGELAQLLSPFTIDEEIILPPRSACRGYEHAIVKGIWPDNEYGYHLYVYVMRGDGRCAEQFSLPGHINGNLEEANGKTPVMGECEINNLLAPFRVDFSEY